jgi:hypothetical protein
MKYAVVFKSLLFSALIFIVFLSGCKKDPVYTSVNIKNFKLTQIPFVQPNGNSWEDIPLVEGGPDVYWLLTDIYDTVYFGTRDIRFDNATPQNLPLIKALATPLNLTPPGATWYLKVYDYDLIGGDDLMATIGPFSFETYKKEHPSTISLTGDSATMVLDLEWVE